MLTLIFFTSFATVYFLFIGVTMRGERAVLNDRVREIAGGGDLRGMEPELAVPFGDRIMKPWLRRIASWHTGFLPKAVSQDLTTRLERAGHPWGLRAADMIGLKIVSIILFVCAGFALSLVAPTTTYCLIFSLGGIVIGFMLPDWLLTRAVEARIRLIRKSLPDSLDLLVVSTEAGLGLEQGIQKVAARIHGPLSDELTQVLDEMSAGRGRVDAMKSMADRLRMAEVTTLVAAINQASTLGVSIAQVLRVQAESLRSHRSLRARESAAKIPVKLLFPLVLFIFPSIFIVLIGPGAVQIWRALLK